jgi:polyphosphate glucokinase
MTRHAVGIDVGGTGIKGALVDLASGELVSDRIKYPTPEHATPEDVAGIIGQILSDIGKPAEGPAIGVCLPAVVVRGTTKTAANISDRWIDFPAERFLADTLGRPVTLLNDADAAGVAEAHFGAAKDVSGLVIVTTLGTGIGSAFIHNGVLVPNTELGHLELDGAVVETTTSRVAAQQDDLDFQHWATRLERFYRHVVRLFSPDLIVVGGGVSKQAGNFLPFISLDTPMVAATHRNNAGILGAAYLAAHAGD